MKNKRRKLFGIFLLIIGVFAISKNNLITDTQALDLEEPLIQLKKGSCTEGGSNFVKAESKYHPYVYVPSHFPDEGYVEAKIKSGVFDVYVYELINGTSHKEEPLQHLVLGGKNAKSGRITYQLYDEPKDYAIIFVLKETDNLCTVTENTKPVQNQDGTWTTSDKYGYIYYYYLGVPSKPNKTQINNLNYNGICSALRNGNYAAYSTVFEAAGLTDTDFNAYRTRVNFPYCYTQRVEYNYSVRETAQIIKNKIAGIKISDDYNKQTALSGPGDATVVEDTDFTSNDKALQCPAYSSTNGLTIPNQSYTTQKYYKSETKNTTLNLYKTTGADKDDGVCSQTCEETITVTYGPPVASKAGLCFEYKVKVESKVNCESKFTAEIPQPEDYEICTPTGACNGGTYHSASGPNDDFDSCINSCDNGEYTQSCINKCYTEVYGSTTTTTTTLPVNYVDGATAKQINRPKDYKYNSANIESLEKNQAELYNYYKNVITSGPDAIGPGKTYSAEELKTALTEIGTGYYDVQSGNIVWNSGEKRYWERPGRYYTLNITNYTLSRLQDAERCNDSFMIGGKKQCGISLIDTGAANGLLRNNAGTSYCTAGCAWYGCTKAKSNGYYKNGKATEATNRQFLNSADAIEVYKLEFDIYKAAAADCKAKATCSTKTAEYTIKVNNKLNSESKDNWIEYSTSITNGNLSGTTITTKNGSNGLGSTSIVLDRSGCYQSVDQFEDSTTSNYMTEWSFPGTWINNKTGKISYQPNSDNNTWHLKKEKFCTNLDSRYVNTSWWTQRVLKPKENVTSQATIDEYNIEAMTKNFGHFSWDFKIKCFYALYDSPIPNDDDDKEEETAPLSYNLRTVDLGDMFPNNQDETATTNPEETGRTPGYNWTDEATNIKNKDYEVTPGALYSVIQARADEIYDADKTENYLDYEFYLSPSDLSKIRAYSKDAGNNYNKFLGEIRVENGIAYYASALFRNVSNAKTSNKIDARKLGVLGVNNQDASGRAETFTNTYTANLRSSEDYLSYISGGNK
ncbi:MAG: hypothetical protein PUC82_04295 [bacterium]|nr:hypothetical protein [bacterium]